MSCKCVDQVNEQLKAHDTNTQLMEKLTMDFSTMKCESHLVIATYKVDSSKRESASTMLASCCPFCGKSFAKKPAAKRKAAKKK